MDPDKPSPSVSPIPAIPVNYAEPSTPQVGGASPNTAAGLLIFGGLGLVFLGGCFCVGILVSMDQKAPGVSLGIFQVVLYIIVLACLSGAVLLFYLAVRGLLRVMQGKR